MSFLIFEISLAVFAVLWVVELVLKGRWVLPYFRLGIPLPRRSVPVAPKRPFDHDAVSVFFNQHDNASPMLFKEAGPGHFLFKSLFLPRGTKAFSVGVTALFHGTLDLEDGKITLRAHHNNLLLAAVLVIVSFLAYLLHHLAFQSGGREVESIVIVSLILFAFILFTFVSWHHERDRLDESLAKLVRYLQGEVELPRPGGP